MGYSPRGCKESDTTERLHLGSSKPQLKVRKIDRQTDRQKSLSRVQLFATPWIIAYQAPRSMGFSGHEYWSVLPFTSPGDLPDPGIEPGSPAL